MTGRITHRRAELSGSSAGGLPRLGHWAMTGTSLAPLPSQDLAWDHISKVSLARLYTPGHMITNTASNPPFFGGSGGGFLSILGTQHSGAEFVTLTHSLVRCWCNLRAYSSHLVTLELSPEQDPRGKGRNRRARGKVLRAVSSKPSFAELAPHRDPGSKGWVRAQEAAFQIQSSPGGSALETRAWHVEAGPQR